jgi:hypothetical protein
MDQNGESKDSLEELVSDMEACALHLAICEDKGQIDPSEERYLVACIDHISNTYDIDPQSLRDHAHNVQSIWSQHEESRALKYIETAHEAFLSEISDEYEPTF